MRLITLFASLLVYIPLVIAVDDSPADEAIKEAITILEARKAQADKKEDQEKIGRAIGDLKKQLQKQPAGVAKKDDDLSKLLTPAILKKKFAGKAAFTPKTGELILIYDLSTKDQFKDFNLGSAKPKLNKGILDLEPGESIEHVVKFSTLKLTGVFTCGAHMGDHIQTSGGIRIVGGGTLVTGVKNKYAESGFKTLKTATPFELLIDSKRVAIGFGPKKGGVAVDGNQRCGHVRLCGASGGNQFSKLVFTGTVDSEWAKEFFKE